MQAPKRQLADDSRFRRDFAKAFEVPVIICKRAGRSKTTSDTSSSAQKSLPRTSPRKGSDLASETGRKRRLTRARMQSMEQRHRTSIAAH